MQCGSEDKTIVAANSSFERRRASEANWEIAGKRSTSSFRKFVLITFRFRITCAATLGLPFGSGPAGSGWSLVTASFRKCVLSHLSRDSRITFRPPVSRFQGHLSVQAQTEVDGAKSDGLS